MGRGESGSWERIQGPWTMWLVAIALVAGLLSASCGIASAQSGGWTSSQGNPQGNGISPYNTTAEGGGVQWVFSSQPSSSVSGLVIAPDGTIYTTVGVYPKERYIFARSTESIYAINPDGTVKWVSETLNEPRGMTTGMDGTLYCTVKIVPPPPYPQDGFWNSSTDSVLFALSPENGSVIWSYNPPELSDQDSIGAVIGGPDGRVFFSAMDDICALDHDGQLLWNLTIPGHTTICMFQNGTILTSDHGHLYYILPNGTIDAVIPIAYEDESIGGSPTIAPNGDVVLMGNSTIGVDALYRIDSAGVTLWSYQAEENVTFMSLSMDPQGNVYVLCQKQSVGLNGNFYSPFYTISINPEGLLRWTTEHETFVWATSADGILYGLTVYDPLGFASVKFTALDQDGRVLWEKDILNGPSPLYGSYSYSFGAAAIAPDGSVYFLGQVYPTYYGYIVSIRGTPQGTDPGLSEQYVIIATSVVSIVALLACCLLIKRRSGERWQP